MFISKTDFMPNNCPPAIKNAAAKKHTMPKLDFNQATKDYFGTNPVKPITVGWNVISQLIDSLECSVDCVIFTAKDSKVDETLTWRVAKVSCRYNTKTRTFENDAIGDEIQTTFSVTLLSYFVDKQSDFHFYKIRQGSDKGLAFSVLGEIANHGDLGPDKVTPPKE